MISIDPQASLKYFRSIGSHVDRDVQRRLDRFQRSLEMWLHSALNWPQDDWEADLRLFVEHTRYAGWEISPHSLGQIRELLEARSKRSGLFAIARAARSHDVDKPTIQPAAVMAPGDDTDATLDLTSEDAEEVEETVDLEVAGPGPEVSAEFKAKVQTLLKILDAVAAEVWETEGGIVRSRDARGPWLNYYSERIDGHPAIIVDQSFTVSDTVLAILEETYASRANSIRSEMLRRWISGDGAAARLREIQTQAYKEAAAEAAMIAEMYYGTLASLTPGGDLVVTLDDIERNGPSLSHALVLLPALAMLGRRGTGLVLKIAGGRALRVPKELLEKLVKLPKEALDKLAAKVRQAKTPEEAINIIDGHVKRVHGHHIATDKNWVSPLRGGPWSPQFAEIFERAGMTLTDAENVVKLPGHRGPHSEKYHRKIYTLLQRATAGKSGPASREALISELKRIAKELKTKGTELNRLLFEKSS